ncbi:MAG TPA: pilus assembly protein TadG-related protein [Xanthobacteraceae bacterium]|nr:pilus assembly protein TadG-related protein [Xanthobacteraceae bacterium]
MRLRKFLQHREGSVAPLLALGILPVLGITGAAVDYSRVNAARTTMQAALDATVLMLAKSTQNLNTPIAAQAQTYFVGNLTSSSVNNVSVTATVAAISGGLSVSGSATGTVSTMFMQALGFETLTITVKATALALSDGLGCVLALNPAASGAVTSQGSTAVALNNCSLYDNSNHATALVAGGSSNLSALSVGVVGGISGSNNITTTQGIYTNMPAPVADPYANDSFPAPPSSCQNQAPIHSTKTLSPGFFCGLTLNSDANVTLDPGIYYIGKSGLSVNGNATLTGTGVTLVFTASNGGYGGATINGGANVNLTAPNFGPTAGIVIFGDRNMPTGTSFKLNGGSSQYFGGAVYVPKGAVEFSGNQGTSTKCTQIIGDTVTFTGNSDVAINCSSYKTKPFSPYVVRLVK